MRIVIPLAGQVLDMPDAASFGTAEKDVATPLRPVRQTTVGLPPDIQFEAWQGVSARVVEYQAPATMPANYDATATTWLFAGLALVSVEAPPGVYRRSATSVRRDGLDVWSFSTARQGLHVYRPRGRTVVMRPGQLALVSLAQPFEAAHTASDFLHLYVPRSRLADIADRITEGVSLLETPGGLLLRDHILLLAEELPHMSAADADRMAEATCAMIALAIAPTPARQEAAAAPAADVQMMRLRSLIRANLGQATLTPSRLGRMAGISRSQLYRLFEPDGGVALTIQRERLNAAYRALSNPADTRGISEIAESVGLFDSSSFSRMFRRAFGILPRDLRLARSAGMPAVGQRSTARANGSSCLADLLRFM